MEFTNTLPTMLCCECGIAIEPNKANMCVSCLRNKVDICEDIGKAQSMYSCRTCHRFLLPPWSDAQLESKELMAACLKKVTGLSKLKLIDAVWIWTEPHSMRLKIKITVQKEVVNGAILQQACVITYVVRNQQCEHCQQQFATGAWHSVVQVRQRVSHKRTFYYLEQLLLKHRAHSECVNIVAFKDGMDFYFIGKQQGVRFISFLESHIPCKTKYSRKLVSADIKNGTANFKHNHIVEIVPVCKDDLLILPKTLANNLSDISPLCMVKSVNAGIHLIDPCTAERQELNAEKYWKNQFIAKMTSKELTKFIVLSVELVSSQHRVSAKRRRIDNAKLRIAECVIARERDFGQNDIQFTVISHLGSVLREGDEVMGFDLTNASWANELDVVKQIRRDLPDVILVRKVYAPKGDRVWQLKHLDIDEDERKDKNRGNIFEDRDYNNFLQELDADKEMRSTVNLYKDPKMAGANMDTDLDEEEVHIDELLEGLEIDENEGNDGEDEDIVATTRIFNSYQGLAVLEGEGEEDEVDEDDL